MSLTAATSAVARGSVTSAELDPAGSIVLRAANGSLTRATFPPDYAGELTATLLAAQVEVTTASGSAVGE
ncbi:MAG TPA: hypothetical protein PKB06_11440, partial [Actinotalea sp.]|nr:hypothetical protein [Actinotalea sp.]